MRGGKSANFAGGKPRRDSGAAVACITANSVEPSWRVVVAGGSVGGWVSERVGVGGWVVAGCMGE